MQTSRLAILTHSVIARRHKITIGRVYTGKMCAYPQSYMEQMLRALLKPIQPLQTTGDVWCVSDYYQFQEGEYIHISSPNTQFYPTYISLDTSNARPWYRYGQEKEVEEYLGHRNTPKPGPCEVKLEPQPWTSVRVGRPSEMM